MSDSGCDYMRGWGSISGDWRGLVASMRSPKRRRTAGWRGWEMIGCHGRWTGGTGGGWRGFSRGVEDAVSGDQRLGRRIPPAHAVERHRNGLTIRRSIGQDRCCTKCCTNITLNTPKRLSTPRSPPYLSITCAKLNHFVIDRSPVQFRSSAPSFQVFCPASSGVSFCGAGGPAYVSSHRSSSGCPVLACRWLGRGL